MSIPKPPALVAIACLAAAAAAWNLNAPTIFFDSQIMLGSSLAVFALLQFGWPGLVVGVAALSATALRWGHPFELLIGMAFLVWLVIYLDRLNGGWNNRDNGRVVLAAAAFWLVAGIPLEVVLIGRAFDLSVAEVFGIALKESVAGLLNTSLGLLAFLAVRWGTLRGQPGTFSVRGLTFAAILAAISLPGFGLTLILSHQLKAAVLDRQFQELYAYGQRVADLADLGATEALATLARSGPDKHFLLRSADGAVRSSDPALFERLERHYEVETPPRTGRADLGILRPTGAAPVIRSDADSYWFITCDRPPGGPAESVAGVTVVETPPDMVRRLDYELLLPSFCALFVLLLGGAVAADWAGRAVDRQFKAVFPPLGGVAPAVAPLAASAIRELDTLVAAVNDRTRRAQAAAAREQQLEEAHRRDLKSKLKSSLAASAVAHEINQPLSRMLLRAHLTLEQTTGRERDSLSALIADAQQVVTIIDKMRVLLRNVQTPHDSVDLAEVVASAVLQVKMLLRREGIAVQTSPADGRCLITGDDVQLQIALTNLLTNAAHAITGSDSPRREIQVAILTHPDTCELVVGDSGPGWPGGTIEDMLLRTSKPDGSGIGLFVVKTTVDHHRGRLAVGRSPLGGAEFRITLARVPDAAEEPASARP